MLFCFRASFCRVNVCFLAYEMLPCFSDFSLLCKTRASLSLSLSLILFLRKLCPGCCCYCLPRLVRAALTTNQCVSQPKMFLSYRKKKHESYLFTDRVTITASLALSQNHVLRNGAHCFRCLTARGREEYNAAGPTL